MLTDQMAKSLLERLPYGVMIFQVPSHRPGDIVLIYVNQELDRYAPTQLSAFIGRPLRDTMPGALLDPEVRQIPEAAIRVVEQRTEEEIPEFHVPDRQRSTRCYRARLVPLDNRQVAVAIFDITSKRTAEIQLQESEERYRRFIEGTDDLAIKTDGDGVIAFVNRRSTAYLGLEPHECVGRNMISFLHPADKRLSIETFQSLIRNREPGTQYENRVVHRNGEVYHFLWTINVEYDRRVVKHAHAIGRDISERVRAREELNLFFEVSLDMPCIAGFDGYFKRLGSAWSPTLGWSNAELMSRPFIDFVHPDDRDSTFMAAEVLSKGGKIVGFDNRYLAKDGTYRWFSWSSYGDVERGLIFASARDVTRRKRAEDDLIQARDEAEFASRSKSEFLATMSHELRTPLNAVIGFSQILVNRTFGEVTEKQERYLNGILTSGRHLLNLINDILDLSKIEAGKMSFDPRPIDLASVVESTTNLLRDKAVLTGIRLTTETSEALVGRPVIADERKIKQILFNLVSNALKFTAPDGSVTVRAEILESYAEIAVKDTGVGIAPEDQERVFDAFVQIDGSPAREQSGTGLGLALTRKLVELHGGTIRVFSEGINRGSEFAFTIPLHQLDTDRDEPRTRTFGETAPEPGVPSASARPLVLVVDDEPDARELLAQHLREAGYFVEFAQNGEEAIEKYKRLQPDAVTLDILLPDINGRVLARQIRNMAGSRRLPLVIVSVTEPETHADCPDVNAWLVKPVEATTLRDALATGHAEGPDGKPLT